MALALAEMADHALGCGHVDVPYFYTYVNSLKPILAWNSD